MPGAGIAGPFGLAASGGQLLDRLQRGSSLMNNKKEGGRGGRRRERGEKGRCTPSRKGRVS